MKDRLICVANILLIIILIQKNISILNLIQLFVSGLFMGLVSSSFLTVYFMGKLEVPISVKAMNNCYVELPFFVTLSWSIIAIFLI